MHKQSVSQSDTLDSCNKVMVQQQNKAAARKKMRRTLKATFHNATHEGIKLHIQ